MKKITIITNGTLPVPASKGGAVENLLQTFLDLNEKTNDFQLIVFTVSDDRAKFLGKVYKNTKFVFIESENFLYKIERGCRFLINKIKANTFKNQFIFKVLKHKVLINESDIVLIENNPNYLQYIRKITSKPVGLHLHNDYLNIDDSIYASKVLDGIDFVIGVSQYIKDRVVEIAPKQCKVDIAYNGINLERFDFANTQINRKILQEKYGISDNEVVVLFTGRLQKTKGIDLLLDVFIEISETHNVKLLIVGSSGFASSNKTKFIRELEIKSRKALNRIVFTGYIDYSQIHHIYNLANFAVLPSLATEAISLTCIEALASGLPVIVSDSGGMQETINEKCGIVIKRGIEMKENLKKEMEKLIVDEILRNTMSIEAKKRAQKFSDFQYYKSLSSFLKSI